MAENEQQVEQQFLVQRFYVKDVSFETPLGVEVFTKQWQPKINVDLNTKNTTINEETHEVVLTITLTAKIEEDTAFLIEVQQAGLFLVKNIEGETLRRALGIMAPNLLFPYLRETVDAIAVKGGFPAIGLQPVNFEALYMQALQQAEQQQAESGAH